MRGEGREGEGGGSEGGGEKEEERIEYVWSNFVANHTKQYYPPLPPHLFLHELFRSAADHTPSKSAASGVNVVFRALEGVLRAEVHERIEVKLVVIDGVHHRGQIVDAQAPSSLELGRRGIVVWCKFSKVRVPKLSLCLCLSLS